MVLLTCTLASIMSPQTADSKHRHSTIHHTHIFHTHKHHHFRIVLFSLFQSLVVPYSLGFKEFAPVYHKYSADKDFTPANSIVSGNIYPVFTNVISGFTYENRMQKLFDHGDSRYYCISYLHHTHISHTRLHYILVIFRKFSPILMASMAPFMRSSSTDKVVVVFVVVQL